jgi:hypothetical protein
MNMLDGALDKVVGYLDRRLVVVALLPSLVFWSALLWLVVASVGWPAASDWWGRLAPEARVLVGVGAASWIGFFASGLSIQIGRLTRLYEGYWGRCGPGRWLAAVGVWLQRRRHDRLDPADDHDFEVRYRNYPRRRQDLLPTRLGNILRAAELYPADEGRYGMDAVFFWPRLYVVLPESMRTVLQEAQAALDLMLVTSSLGLAFTAAAAGFLAATRTGHWLPWVTAVGGGALVAIGAYRSAVQAAITFAEQVRTAFDMYRGALLTQLGYSAPGSREEEESLWRNLGQQLYRRLADDPQVLRVRYAGAAVKLDVGPASAARGGDRSGP